MGSAPRDPRGLVCRRRPGCGRVAGQIARINLRGRMEADLIQWIKQDRLHYRDEIVDGLENAPEAVNRLYDGCNLGMLMVRIDDEP